jgi:thioredoxin-related protein
MIFENKQVILHLSEKTMKKSLLIIFLSALSLNVFSQEVKVKWYTLQEAEQLSLKSFRPMFIDAYTDWCGWCRKMDQDTFTNPVIAEILNTRFYPVKFNAEGKEDITFFGQKFVNDGKAGKAHQLAVTLLNGQLSYPTVVFLTRQGEKFQVSPVPGYRQPKEMEMLLSFFAEKAYETGNWQEYSASFRGKIE